MIKDNTHFILRNRYFFVKQKKKQNTADFYVCFLGSVVDCLLLCDVLEEIVFAHGKKHFWRF